MFLPALVVQAQTIDSTDQKPQLNNELPGAPVPVPTQPTPRAPQPAPPPVATPDTPPAPTQPSVSRQTPDDEETPTFVDRLFVGSTGGLGFSSDPYFGNFFNLSISPFVGYRIFDRWAVGPGLTYEYISTNGYRLSTYGGKLFTQLDIYKGFLAHLEHEILSAANLEVNRATNQVTQSRRSISSTLAGGGYRQTNGKFGMDMYVLFALNTGVYQYRSNPVVRVGFVYFLNSSR